MDKDRVGVSFRGQGSKTAGRLPLRRLPTGAEFMGKEGVHFRVWAPRRNSVKVVLETELKAVHSSQSSREFGLEPESEAEGYFSGFVPHTAPGTLYRFRLDGSERAYPDPLSRFQPAGPHGPSQVVDPASFKWTDGEWKGVQPEQQVLYEMHIGTFTPEGSWSAAADQLPELARLGVTVLEIMPIADFAGRFGWGYDGVNFFAPTRLYGSPDDLRAFINRAHGLGLGVILDVVYNHFGPDGCYLKEFSEDYFTVRYENDWGEALNFDGPDSGPVREFFTANARYWIEEFHFDGLRLDATQQIYDCSREHILAAVTREVRAAAQHRATYIIAENELQHVRLVRPVAQGGFGMDALWNDDFHHSAMVALTGRNEAYYTDYLGKPQEFISAAKWGFLYQGQHYKWQMTRRGTPSIGLTPAQFINFIHNHDQVANSLRGIRVHQLTSPGQYRAMTALLLLMPGTPMLFQGQEFAASSPFHYFSDLEPALAKLAFAGRKKFLSQFPSLALKEAGELIDDPAAEATFIRSKLNFADRVRHAEVYRLHRDLLRLRRDHPVFTAQRRGSLDGAVLGEAAFLLRFFGENDEDRLLLVNLGVDLHLDRAPEPLLAPPLGKVWTTLWSSEDTCYGGTGTPPLETEENWRIPGHAAVVLAPAPDQQLEHGTDHPENTVTRDKC